MFLVIVDITFGNAESVSIRPRSVDACHPGPGEICCGLQPFNPDSGDKFCCAGIVVEVPSGCTTEPPAYNISRQVCLYGQTVSRETKCAPHNVTFFCCGDIIDNVPVTCEPDTDLFPDHACCGLALYSMDVYDCCGTTLGKSNFGTIDFTPCHA